ncbi:MAG: ATP-dependent helicase C-terminal domain-containing protein, partial [Gemmataceae bacterium]
ESAEGAYLARYAWLREQWPECELPAIALEELLPELCQGQRSFAEVRMAAWADALRGRLSYAQSQLVEREAPASITVPGGREVPLDYATGAVPILAVRIQEVFGWNSASTPKLAGGRVRILFHLLAPNDRPQQVTDNLESFWLNGYPVVRKELRGRYPKHDWPEDPLTATPSRGPKRRN